MGTEKPIYVDIDALAYYYRGGEPKKKAMQISHMPISRGAPQVEGAWLQKEEGCSLLITLLLLHTKKTARSNNKKKYYIIIIIIP